MNTKASLTVKPDTGLELIYSVTEMLFLIEITMTLKLTNISKTTIFRATLWNARLKSWDPLSTKWFEPTGKD